MSLKDWAEKEIYMAIDSEKKAANGNEEEWKYGVLCYESALKAFESLLEDGHSGASIMFTKSILNRLIDGKCLTPIEDTNDIWELISDKNSVKEYQCKRMHSLFKTEKDSGEVTYSDLDRVQCIDIDSPDIPFHNGMARILIDKLIPITMPYLPYIKPFKLFTETFLYDTSSNEDFDTRAFLYLIAPNGIKIDIYKYTKEVDGVMTPIPKEEYEERKEKAMKNIKNSIKS